MIVVHAGGSDGFIPGGLLTSRVDVQQATIIMT